ncbi:MAG: thioesterase family protein [Proteobacteria bacterium]|nr:thioesterase family protein [Pseudomonadota bacterium]
MTLYYRVLRILIAGLLGKKVTFFEPLTRKFQVLLNDIDLNIHMNNARYLSIMDLGRFDFLVRSGLARFFITEKWQAVLGGVHIRFRRGLRPFQKYTLTTRIVGLDEKWAYIEQRFDADGQMVAHALARAVFTIKGKPIPTTEVLKKLGMDPVIKPLSPVLERWKEVDNDLRTSL